MIKITRTTKYIEVHVWVHFHYVKQVLFHILHCFQFFESDAKTSIQSRWWDISSLHTVGSEAPGSFIMWKILGYPANNPKWLLQIIFQRSICTNFMHIKPQQTIYGSEIVATFKADMKSYIQWENAAIFLCRLWSIATHRDHFVSLSFCHAFQSYVSQATCILGMLPLFFLSYPYLKQGN